MVQMTENLDQKCILMVSNEFQIFFEKFRNLADFCPKNPIFSRFFHFFFETRFSAENVSTLTELPKLTPILVLNVPWGALHKNWYRIWLIFS